LKYLILSKKPASRLPDLSTDRLAELVGIVEKAKTEGKVDGIYGRVGGGLVAIVNADDQAVIARLLRKYGIHDAEVHPLRDATDLIRGHLASITSESPA
jgi:hypothetical protein